MRNNNRNGSTIIADGASAVKKNVLAHWQSLLTDCKRELARKTLCAALERDLFGGGDVNPEYVRLVLDASAGIADADGEKVLALGYRVAYGAYAAPVDPGRTRSADKRDANAAPDNSGHNITLMRERREIHQTVTYRDALAAAIESATTLELYTAGDNLGKYHTVTADSVALADSSRLIRERMPDGADAVQTVLVTLYALADDACKRYGIDGAGAKARRRKLAAAYPHWIVEPYTVRELARRVYIRLSDSAAYRDRAAIALRELYRAVRRTIRDSRAVRADISGYTYIALDDIADDGDTAAALDGVLYRAGRYADIGGYASDSMALYTSDGAGSVRAALARERLERELSPQQRDILRLRLKGYGKKAIATYFGVRDDNVKNQLNRIRDKARAIGIMPDGITLDAIDD